MKLVLGLAPAARRKITLLWLQFNSRDAAGVANGSVSVPAVQKPSPSTGAPSARDEGAL